MMVIKMFTEVRRTICKQSENFNRYKKKKLESTKQKTELKNTITTLTNSVEGFSSKLLFGQSCPTLPPHGLQPTRLLYPWSSPGKNIGVGCHFLLQGISLTQGLNLGLLHCRQILYSLSYNLRLFYTERKTRISLNFGLTYTTYLCCQILSYKMSTLLIITDGLSFSLFLSKVLFLKFPFLLFYVL